MFNEDYSEQNSKIRLAFSFDFGFKKIGIAKGVTNLKNATPLQVVTCKKNKTDWQTIDKLIQLWQPDFFIIGIPSYNESINNPVAKAARGFVKKLFGKYGKICFLVDESYSSLEAHEYLQINSIKPDKGYIDSYAACVILESFFNSHTNIVNVFDHKGWRINEQTT